MRKLDYLYQLFDLPKPISQPDVDEVEIFVSGDLSSSKTFILKVVEIENGLVEVVSRREGKSGVCYVRRQIDCNTNRARQTADAESLDKLSEQNFESEFSVLMEDSSSYVISRFICRSKANAR